MKGMLFWRCCYWEWQKSRSFLKKCFPNKASLKMVIWFVIAVSWFITFLKPSAVQKIKPWTLQSTFKLFILFYPLNNTFNTVIFTMLSGDFYGLQICRKIEGGGMKASSRVWINRFWVREGNGIPGRGNS